MQRLKSSLSGTLAVSAECGPAGRTVSKVVTGASGDAFEARVGDPGFDVRLAVEDDRDAFALQHELDVGEGRVAVGDQVGRAPSGFFSTGVCTAA